ncbi:hypothetical protein BDR22DRAFT_581805 [Usnea florida]
MTCENDGHTQDGASPINQSPFPESSPTFFGPGISDFASCATNRTVSATWACRKERLTMNSCMIDHASQKEQDAAREEWFAGMESRRLEMEEKKRQRVKGEKFRKEWWDTSKPSCEKEKEKAEEE